MSGTPGPAVLRIALAAAMIVTMAVGTAPAQEGEAVARCSGGLVCPAQRRRGLAGQLVGEHAGGAGGGEAGEADPARGAAFLAKWPEAEKSLRWSAEAPWADSYATSEVNSVHAFGLVASDGRVRYMRWVMRPHAEFSGITTDQRAQAEDDFLSRNLQASLDEGPVRFDMVMSLAEPGDPIDDPSQPWPEDRTRVVAGTLEVTALHDQARGPCRDINFDPTIVPAGIVLSGDPVLAARSGVYAQSFNARVREIGRGLAAEAIGEEPAQ